VLATATLDELRNALADFMDIRLNRWNDAALADAASMACYAALERLLARLFPDEGAVHTSLLKAIPDVLTFYLAGTYGSETNGQAKTCSGIPCPGAGAGAKRGVVTLNGTVTPIEGLSFIVDSVYGNESNILPDPITGDPNSAAASWYGLVGYVTWAPGFDPVPGFQFALRAEVFDDVDGARNPTGTVNPAVIGTPQTVEEVTGTISYVFSPNIVTRLEYRYDHSDKFAYEKDLADSYSKTANTITAELILAF